MFDDFDGPAGAPPNAELWGMSEGNVNKDVLLTTRPDNVRLDGAGNLAITLRQERVPGYTQFPFTGGRVKTLGLYEFTYGDVRARIKVPANLKGVWPSFFLIGSGSPKWPDCGEIDIFDSHSGTSGVALHAPGYGNSVGKFITLDDDWHEYWLHWEPDLITIGIDDDPPLIAFTPKSLARGKKWLFNDWPMFILLDVKTGNFGTPNASTPMPATLLVDWIRHDPLEDWTPVFDELMGSP